MLIRIERRYVNGVGFSFQISTEIDRTIKEVFSIGKKDRPAITHRSGHLLFKPGQDGDLASRVRNTSHGDPAICSKHNYAIPVPGAATSNGSITNYLHWSPGSLNFLQFSVSKECNESVVRRPERIRGIFGILQHVGA